MLLWATGTYRGFYLTSQTQNVGMVSPIKFAQLVLLILLPPLIFPVPQNKIIYTGGSYWHFERNDNSCTRMTYALKCHQNPPPTSTTKKIPRMSQHPLERGFTASYWEPLTQVGSFGTILIAEASVPSQFLVVSWFLEFAGLMTIE